MHYRKLDVWLKIQMKYENLTGRKNLRIIELINGIKDKEYTDKMI